MPTVANACSPRRNSLLRVRGLLWVMPTIKCPRSSRDALATCSAENSKLAVARSQS